MAASLADADTDQPQWRDTAGDSDGDGGGDGDDRDDPMAALMEIEPATDAKCTKKRVRPKARRAPNSIKTIHMPQFEPTSHPGRTETRAVCMFAARTNSIWICVDDIPWAIRWIHDELQCGGVPMLDDDPLADLETNCECPNVHIRWDFQGAWEAIILAGDKRGDKIKSYVEKLDQRKWDVVGASTRYAVTFATASSEQVKRATRDYLESCMRGIVSAGAQTPN